ncbi:hypothetical protein BO70DRAFT_366589 [Aspergillus heteromorphus CBS 117.55]|uniref:SUN domain-containing protein n=1 Tax=Aspergillus heteromorphus CBS 117.55 TaxID=1448321 RepID=A0A317V007_9EURO|nr:uncharacterized protein BO70DRAFT_366589 [Aspergillus heteromorphus CBS 117.55]PWY66112.1 hypothetical protein BO70DRAFT_366589 [Aspergillus heteromorphus CBS 117.55]
MVSLAAAVFSLVAYTDLSSLRRPVQYVPMNDTNMVEISSLTDQLSRLGVQVSSLAKDVKQVKSDVRAAPTTVIEAPARRPFEAPVVRKTNFLTRGLRVVIDPYFSSPTIESNLTVSQTWFYRVRKLWTSDPGPQMPQPHLAALSSWEDFGDSWCGAPHFHSGMTQLSVVLGHDIVPEEVVVEHMPKHATLSPEVAPRDMELWAQFKLVDLDPPPKGIHGRALAFLARAKIFPSSERFSIHEAIMHALRYAFPHDPESAYSNDPFLPPTFYRVGKWTYDLDGAHHVQRFVLDAVIDDPKLRVNHVVFRVTSNYGGPHTCLYRVKLFGHK